MEKEIERELQRADEKIISVKRELVSDIKELRRKDETHETRIRTLETRTTIAESDIKTLCDDMRAIKGHTTWILRLVIGILIGGMMSMIIIGG